MLDNACGQGVPHPLSATNFTTPVLRSPSFAHATAEPDLIIMQAQRRSARRCPKPSGYGAIIGDAHAKGVTWSVPDYGGLFGSDRGSALAAVARLRHVHCARAARKSTFRSSNARLEAANPEKRRGRVVGQSARKALVPRLGPVPRVAQFLMGERRQGRRSQRGSRRGCKAAKSLQSPTADFHSYIWVHF